MWDREAPALIAVPGAMADVRQRRRVGVTGALVEGHGPVERGEAGISRVSDLLVARTDPAARIAGDRLPVVVGRRGELDDEAGRQSVRLAGGVGDGNPLDRLCARTLTPRSQDREAGDQAEEKGEPPHLLEA